MIASISSRGRDPARGCLRGVDTASLTTPSLALADVARVPRSALEEMPRLGGINLAVAPTRGALVDGVGGGRSISITESTLVQGDPSAGAAGRSLGVVVVYDRDESSVVLIAR